jgi:hypothetical protein
MRTIVLVWTLAITVATGSVPAAAANLLGHWKLDENPPAQAQDSSGGMNHGTPKGNVKQFQPGKVGNALEVGANGEVVISKEALGKPDLSRLEPEHLTVEAWVKSKRKYQGSFPRLGYIVAKGALGCRTASYALYANADGFIAFYVASGTDPYRSHFATPDEIWDGNWHHLTGTYDGKHVRLCVDGEEKGEGLAQLPAPPGPINYKLESDALYIGHYKDLETVCPSGFGWTNDMPVIIDQVKIWDQAKNCGECGHKKRKHCWLKFWK